jgi:uncharacterized membrane protein YedE/YeeE
MNRSDIVYGLGAVAVVTGVALMAVDAGLIAGAPLVAWVALGWVIL